MAIFSKKQIINNAKCVDFYDESENQKQPGGKLPGFALITVISAAVAIIISIIVVCVILRLDDIGIIYDVSEDGEYAEVVSYHGTATTVVIPDTYNGLPVRTIRDSAFSHKSVTSITIPDSVTCIERYAFAACENLKSVTIPDSVTSIDEGAFSGCTSLINITIPSDLTSISDHTFNGCVSLVSITIPSAVKSIGTDAFMGCYKIIEVINKSQLNITDGIDVYGGLPFYVKDIHNGESRVVNLNDYLFYTYDEINYLIGYVGDDTELILPQNYNGENYEIYEYAFYSRDGLEGISIPESVTNIGDFSFYECESLESIAIPDSVVILGGSSFGNCNSLVSVTFGENSLLEYIGRNAFENCVRLVNIAIPASVTNIGWQAFRGCTAIQNMTLPFVGDDLNGTNPYLGYIFGADSCYNNSDYVPISFKSVTVTGGESIGYGAFYGCVGLKSVTIPDSVIEICEDAFNSCVRLTSVTFGENSRLETIGIWSFNGCVGLESITIPDGVTSIEDCAFRDCKGLKSITISDSVTHIGASIFSGCAGLESITIPSSITSIGHSAFANCAALTSITIPASVTSIYLYAFDCCTSLTDVYYTGTEQEWSAIFVDEGNTPLTSAAVHYDTTSHNHDFIAGKCECGELAPDYTSDGLSYIRSNDGTYYILSGIGECTDTDVVIPETYNGLPVEQIAAYAFKASTTLKSITIPNSVTTIGEYAFAFCTSLASIEIPDNVINIAHSTFRDCDNLTSVTFGENSKLKTIDAHAFCSCDALATVTFGENSRLETIGFHSFCSCDSLVNITIPKSVTSIGPEAFYECKGLASITIPDNITIIDALAFSGCTSLSSITIPNSVTSMGDCAFSDCTSLTDVYYTGTEQEWLQISIGDENTLLTSATIHYGYVLDEE